MYFEILRCGLSRWTSIWGDPLVTGLVIMGLFIVAAGLCAVVAARRKGREALFWALAAAAALIFAANVHLDLHVLPKSIGHCAAHAQGWYQEREAARSAFIIVAAIALTVLLLTVFWVFWRQLMANITLSTGFALTVALVAAKGFGRKRWEVLFDVPLGPVSFSAMAEMIGAVLVIIGAALVVFGAAKQAHEAASPP